MAITAGQTVHASDLNALSGQLVILDADFTVNNNASLASTSLTLPLAANSKYALEMFVAVDSNTTADYQYDFTLPSGATINYSPWGGKNADTTDNAAVFHNWVSNTSQPGEGLGSGTINTARPVGTIRTAATAGNATFRFAQNTANVSNTILKADSWMKVTKG